MYDKNNNVKNNNLDNLSMIEDVCFVSMIKVLKGFVCFNI